MLAAGRRSDAGMVTAEAALVLPSLMVVLALAVTVLVTVGAKIKVVDAAREAARIAARGDADAEASRAAVQLGPPGTKVTIRHRGHWVDVDVKAVVRPLGLLPGFNLATHTLAWSEVP